jgi:hypothetical protein
MNNSNIPLTASEMKMSKNKLPLEMPSKRRYNIVGRKSLKTDTRGGQKYMEKAMS